MDAMSMGWRRRSLRREVRQPLRLGNRGWIPPPGERFGFRAVEAHGQVERILGGGQPVRLLVLARVLVLKIEIERAVRVVLEGHPAAHREAIERVRDLEAVRVVERDRPEGMHWRGSILVEVD